MSATPRDDVLDAFAMEEEHGKSTLEHYLRSYPQFAGELIDLSRSLIEVVEVDESPRTNDEETALDRAWAVHATVHTEQIADPFASISPARSRELATALEVPRQVITAFRERVVIPDSVPRGFLRRFAAEMQQSFDQFLMGLALPSASNLARSYKADYKPGATAQVSFERILIDADVPEDLRARLLADVD